MKRIIIFTVGLALLLLSSILLNGQFQTSKKIAAYKKLFTYEGNRKTSELNTLTKKEAKPNRKAARKKTPNYSGRWTGKLYQPNGTLRSKFNFTLRLYQKGKKVSGFSRITIIDSPQYYGVMRLKGTIKRNRLSFTEVKISQENPEPDSRWCIKSGKLKLVYIKGKQTLKGNWRGSSCSPGTIVLKRFPANKNKI